MTDPLRKRLSTRTKVTLAQVSGHTASLTDAQKKTPSQKKSENLRKKLNRGITPPATIGEDCNNCLKYPCGKVPSTCHMLTRKNRCAKCGTVVIYRFVSDNEWKYCEPCRSSFR